MMESIKHGYEHGHYTPTTPIIWENHVIFQPMFHRLYPPRMVMAHQSGMIIFNLETLLISNSLLKMIVKNLRWGD